MNVEGACDNAFSSVREIIGLFGPRLCGSEACSKAAAHIHKKLGECCDDAKIEDFKVHPKAFLGWVRVMDVFFLISNVLCWLNLPIIGTALSLFIVLVMVFEICCYLKFCDIFFPTETGKNTYGVVEPEGEAKQTIVYSAHHDSAAIFGFYEEAPRLFLPRAGFAMGIFFVFFFALCYQDYLLVKEGIGLFALNGTMPPVSRKINMISTLIIPLIFSSWNFARDEGTPGAGDNLISVCIGIELAKYFSKNKLKNTRLIIASFDGEECGLRGSQAFWDAHADELKKLPICNFNVDSPFFISEFTLLKSDINGFLQLDKNFVNEVDAAGKKCGIKCTQKNLLFLLGGTDAAEATRHGVKATTLVGLPWTAGNRKPVYHTSLDLPEAIEPKAVCGVIQMAETFICDRDSKIQ